MVDARREPKDVTRSQIFMPSIRSWKNIIWKSLPAPTVIAANKIDAITDTENNPIDALKAEFEPKGIRVFSDFSSKRGRVEGAALLCKAACWIRLR